MPVCPHGTTLHPLDGFSRKFDSLEFFENLARKLKID
jgi:hypothetical protein